MVAWTAQRHRFDQYGAAGGHRRHVTTDRTGWARMGRMTSSFGFESRFYPGNPWLKTFRDGLATKSTKTAKKSPCLELYVFSVIFVAKCFPPPISALLNKVFSFRDFSRMGRFCTASRKGFFQTTKPA